MKISSQIVCWLGSRRFELACEGSRLRTASPVEKTAVGTVRLGTAVPAAHPRFSGVLVRSANGPVASATPREIVFPPARPIGRLENAGGAFSASAFWVASGLFDFALDSLATLGRALAGLVIVAAAVAVLLVIVGLVRGIRAHRRKQR